MRNIRLELGPVTEEITVVGSFSEIERVASNGVRGSSFAPPEVASIPMVANNVGRNYRAISYQTPGVGFSDASHAPFTVNGNRPLGAVNTMVDSAEYNDPVAGNLLGRGMTEQPVSMETVEAFEIQTSNFKAEFGRASGAIVNLVTKRGGNGWHGSAYHFFQNEKLNARGALLSERPARRLNMPGATLGGPIVRNTLFFYGGYEVGARNQYRASPTIQTLTAEQRARAAPSVRALLPPYPGRMFRARTCTARQYRVRRPARPDCSGSTGSPATGTGSAPGATGSTPLGRRGIASLPAMRKPTTCPAPAWLAWSRTLPGGRSTSSA